MTISKASGDYVKIFGPAVLITLLGFLAAYQFVDPAPPRRISIATGGPQGAYYLFARRYRRILAREGIELDVRVTAGSVENLSLLEAQANGVDVAFVQGGVGRPDDETELTSLASLYFEPLWLFHRRDRSLNTLGGLRGERVAVGLEGSGTRAVALALLRDNGIAAADTDLRPLGGRAAVDALLGGKVDAVFFVASPESPAVRALLEAPGIDLMSFERAEAYTRRHRYLSRVTLPQGVIDLARDVPDRDVALLAPTANLVASRRLHPALVDLLLQAAVETHGSGGLFEKTGQFPASEFLDFPLSDEARRFLERGPPLLQRFLPFWAANLIDRLLVLLLPLVALLIPLLRIMPPVYRWRIRARIYRWYRELKAIDPALHREDGADLLRRHAAEVDRIEREVARVPVPMSYADQLYHLRLHLDLVREKIHAALAEEGDSDPGD